MKMLATTLLILCYVLCIRYFTPYHEWHMFASGIPFCTITKKLQISVPFQTLL